MQAALNGGTYNADSSISGEIEYRIHLKRPRQLSYGHQIVERTRGLHAVDEPDAGKIDTNDFSLGL